MTDEIEDPFRDEVEAAMELLERDDIVGLHVGVATDDEMEYVLAHRTQADLAAGVRTVSLLAQHMWAVAQEADVSLEQVATDAESLAEQIGGD